MAKSSNKPRRQEPPAPLAEPVPRNAARNGGSEAADPRAADQRALGRAISRASSNSRFSSSGRSSPCWKSARLINEMNACNCTARVGGGNGRCAYYDDARRSAGDGSVDQAQRRIRPLSRLRTRPACRRGRGGAAPPRPAAARVAGGEFGVRRRGGKFSSPQSLEKSRNQKILGASCSRD